MTTWTDSAKAKLEEYFTQVRRSLAASGADAGEVTEDLRRHIQEEVAARQLTVVTEQEFTWDNDQGGDSVAGRVRGLSLVQSRQDAVIDPEAALAYVEWTLEFKNGSPLQRESRAQIVLPPGGVVSRLTRWIDGEEREAVFGGHSEVKTAYMETSGGRLKSEAGKASGGVVRGQLRDNELAPR
jgi:hypothetical protein